MACIRGKKGHQSFKEIHSRSCGTDVGFSSLFLLTLLRAPYLSRVLDAFSGGASREQCVHHLVVEFRTATVPEVSRVRRWAFTAGSLNTPSTCLQTSDDAKAIAMNSRGKPSQHIKRFDRGS